MSRNAQTDTTFPVPPSLLGGLSIEAFLHDYWQQKPLLIRNAWPDFRPPLTPEELAGLACEPEVESRLVLERDGEYPWQVKNGPFPEEAFARLPETHWSLLVQRVDRHVPAAAELLRHFLFIPAWRIDDLMISYAPEYGSVGAHIDNYDVFLLQGQGRREWQINDCDYSLDDYLSDMDLKLLPHFEATGSWILEPGDMLYLPPGIAHHGIARDNCMTLSVGFRAPSRLDLLSVFADDCLLAGDDRRYSDPLLEPPRHSHELPAAARAGLRELLREALADDDAVDQWLGRQLTRVETEPLPVPCDPPWKPATFREACIRYGELHQSLDARFLFQMTDNGAALYANGENYSIDDSQIAIWIAENSVLDVADIDALPAAAVELLCTLFNRGLLGFDDVDEDTVCE
ncbi:MAG: cupin domain-containing protein [Gammaproteobacteria bacterium]|nr:cupin domain-containing protein [Gammaproteobacteria bacterium]